jgi:uncharacterized protein (TIGR02118 family)
MFQVPAAMLGLHPQRAIRGNDVTITAISFIRKKVDATIEQYRQHWLNVHGPLAAALPGVRRYVQSHVQHDAAGTNDLARGLRIDGFAQIWFDTEEQRQICYDSEQEVVCDRDSLLWIGASARVVSDFKTLVPLATKPSGVKQIALFLKSPNNAALSPETIADLARLRGVGGMEGLIDHTIVKQGAMPTFKRERVEVDLDRMVELSYDSAETLRRNSPPFRTGAPIALFEVRDYKIV